VNEKTEFIYRSDAPSHLTFLTPECSISKISIFVVLLPICQHGNTALMLAAWYGHVEAAQLLLESKADVNAANKVRTSSGCSA
jgi:hypothetical protein